MPCAGKKISQGRFEHDCPATGHRRVVSRRPEAISFEVVAIDDDDGTIEIQYFDGTVEEMDVEDWESQWEDGALEAAEPPEDWSGSVDVDPDEDSPRADSARRARPARERPRGHRPL